MNVAPCKNCSERCIGCHGKCDKYQIYRTELDKKSQAIRAAKEQEAALWEQRRRHNRFSLG